MRRLTPLMATIVLCVVIATPVPASAAPRSKRANPDGSVPAKWDLLKPPAVSHADEAPATAGGDGTGTNAMPFGSYDDGDMIIALGTATGHTGEWDDYYYYGSLYNKCIWSANTTPLNGVQREAPSKYRTYDYAYGVWVPTLAFSRRSAARTYCRGQQGEPYNIASSKSDQARWYCSKLLWSSYRFTSGIDLDADGGYWVWPVDLLNDSQTSVFAFAK